MSSSRRGCRGIGIGARAFAIGIGLFFGAALLGAGEMAFAYFTEHQPKGLLPIQNGGELAVLYLLAFLLRFILQWVRAGYRNPLSQLVQRVTSPLVIPARRMLPSFAGLDVPTLVVLFALSVLLLEIFIPYRQYARVLKVLTLVLLAYVITGIIIAPDWRGYGRTQWNAQGYWFQDYLADLDAEGGNLGDPRRHLQVFDQHLSELRRLLIDDVGVLDDGLIQLALPDQLLSVTQQLLHRMLLSSDQ